MFSLQWFLTTSTTSARRSSWPVFYKHLTPRSRFLHFIEHAPSYAISYVPQELQHELREVIRHELDKLAKRLPGPESHVVEGYSGRTILEYANTNRIDLIIIESHRPGLEDYFLGSTASHVVRHAACAVHVVR